MDVHAHRPAAPATRFRAWAWGSLALLPISFGFAFVAGEGIATLLVGVIVVEIFILMNIASGLLVLTID